MSRRRLRRDERRQLGTLRAGERHFSRPMTAEIYGGCSPGSEAIKSLNRRGMLRAIGARWVETSTGGAARVERFELTDRGRVVADQLILQEYARHVRLAPSATFGELLAWREQPDLRPYVYADRGKYGLRFRGRTGLRLWPAPERAADGPSPAELGMAPPREHWNGETRAAYDSIRRRALETRQLAKSYSFAERHGTRGPYRVLASAKAKYGASILTGHDPGDEDRAGEFSFSLDGAAETREGEQT